MPPSSILTAPAVFNKEFVISINGEAGLISSLNTPQRIEKIPVFLIFSKRGIFRPDSAICFGWSIRSICRDERDLIMGIIEDKIKDLKEREAKVLEMGGQPGFCRCGDCSQRDPSASDRCVGSHVQQAGGEPSQETREYSHVKVLSIDNMLFHA